MDLKFKNRIWGTIVKDLWIIHDRHQEISKRLEEIAEEQRECLRTLFDQLLLPSSSVPIVTKTPKVTRKRGFQRIPETIPENDVLEQKATAEDPPQAVNEKENNESNAAGGRTKRIASMKASDNIKQSFLAYSPSLNRNDDTLIKKVKRESQLKRKISVQDGSDEDEGKTPSKYSKVDEHTESNEPGGKIRRKASQQIAQFNEDVTKKAKKKEKSQKSTSSSKSGSARSQEKKIKKDDNDAIISPTTDIVEESIYEDAIGKPTPIMNSTLKYSSMVPEKMLNATVVLEPLPQQRKLNETVVIQKVPSQQNTRENSRETRSSQRKKSQQDGTQSNKEAVKQNSAFDNYNGLITDDESSPEVRKLKKQVVKNEKKHVPVISEDEDDDDDDLVPVTPVKNTKHYFKESTVLSQIKQETKSAFKSNALFSPYAKESVKKRVEAFEQAGTQSPKSVDVNAATRTTRTKTRAMAAKEAETEVKSKDKNCAQIMARKSLARAKKIAVEKNKKNNEEFKENKEQVQINKVTKLEKLNTMQIPQTKTTPLTKSKIVIPINRLQTPSNTQNLANHAKPLTASRTNIVTNVDSFIQAPKTVSKNNSAEKLEEKRRQEEDATRKKNEALRLQTEKMRRKREEKELKNKLAREAKEKQELEKRQKTEKEKEEKLKLANLMLEKQREEMDKKRLEKKQRHDEKEERRKLEERQRLLKLQEQEEAEQRLAEQRRREQEAEKRREMEERARQTEAIKLKNVQIAQIAPLPAKYKQAVANKPHGITNYALDSEPDDNDSDDESKETTKHEIPLWAHAHVRKPHLGMQRFIPEKDVFKFFDTRKCTPDLTAIFPGIDRTKLKRNSSAIWDKSLFSESMMEMNKGS